MFATSPSRRRRAAGALIAVSALTAGVAVAKEGEFFIQGAQLTKQSSTTWSGPATLDGVKGRLTLTGTIVLLKQQEHRIRFRWVAGKRLVEGCSFNQVLTRPHDVQLWDGSGEITKTSTRLRKYKGLPVSLYGPTKRNDLKHAKISVRSYKPSARLPARDC